MKGREGRLAGRVKLKGRMGDTGGAGRRAGGRELFHRWGPHCQMGGGRGSGQAEVIR